MKFLVSKAHLDGTAVGTALRLPVVILTISFVINAEV